MKAVQIESPVIFWARVRNGALVVWDGKEERTYARIRGVVRGVYFKDDEYNGQPYQIALFHIQYQDEKWIMSVRVDSQYFRTLCNYLHTCYADGYLSEELTFAPALAEKDGKKYTAIYVMNARGQWVRSYFGQNSALPQPLVTELAQKKYFDWSPVNGYYVAWLKSTFPAGWGDAANAAITGVIPPPPAEDPDDLPF